MQGLKSGVFPCTKPNWSGGKNTNWSGGKNTNWFGGKNKISIPNPGIYFQ